MAKRISSMQQKRGFKDNMPILKDGELAYCVDTQELYIGNAGSNTLINGAINVDDSLEYLKMVAPNGTVFKLSITNEGTLSIVEVGGGSGNPDPDPDPSENLYDGLIINQAYGGGVRGDNNTAVSHSFIELYNTTDKTLNLSKLSVQVFNSNEGEWQKKDLTGFIFPKHSYLIRLARHSEDNLPTTKVLIDKYDSEWDIPLYNKGLKVVLLESKDLLTGTNPFEEEVSGYIDMVGAGDTTIDGYEGTPILGQSKQKSVRRVGFQDTDDNGVDFEIVDFRNIGTEGNTEFNKIPRWINYGSWDENDVYDPEVEEENLYKGLIINQIYGGGVEGDNSTGVSHTFIELYNKGENTIDLSGLSLQWSILGANWTKLNLVGSIPPKHSFLIRGGQHSDPSLPVVNLSIEKFDQSWNTFIYNKGIKVVLMKGTMLITDIANPFNIDGAGTKIAGYIDMFGVAGNDAGMSIDGCETEYGTGSETGQSKQKSFRRVEFRDTDNNLNDFELVDWRLYDVVWNKAPRYLEYGAWDITDEMPNPFDPESGEDSIYPDLYFDGLIINQIYGGGSYMDGATSVSHSFVELYNGSDHNIDLTNCSLQYVIKGTAYDVLALEGTIPPKHSFLVRGMQHNTYDAASCKLSIEEYDQDWEVLINNKGAKVVLMATTKIVQHANPSDIDGNGAKVERYIDMIGSADIAGGTDGSEGELILGQSKQKAVRRKNFADTGNNSVDCEIVDFRDGKKASYFPRWISYGAWDEEDLIFEIPLSESAPNNLVLQMGSVENERVITWQTVSEASLLQVLTNFENSRTLTPETTQTTDADSNIIYCHRVVLDDLQVGYVYSYKVQVNGVWGDEYDYTMPNTSDFGFIHVTDTQSVNHLGYQTWGSTLKKAVSGFSGDFIVHTGDMVQNAASEIEWRGFFNYAKEDLTTIPMVPVIGNNDMVSTSKEIYLRNFGRSGSYYSFDYKNTHFVILDSNADISTQVTWLGSDLAATTKKWKIICIHEAPYMVADEPLSKAFTGIFDQHGVDLVICGHKHTYVRTHKIKANSIDSTGTLYVMSNASSLKHDAKDKLSWHDVNIESGRPSYVTYSISENSIVLDSRKIEGENSISIDTYTLTK